MADIVNTLYTVETGPGYTDAQADPSLSIGSYASTTVWGGGVLGDLFSQASSLDISTGRADYRCIYVYNPVGAADLTDVRVYVTAVTAGSNGFSVGVDARPVTDLDSTSTQAVEPGSAYTAPAGVSFSAPGTYITGLVLGDLPAGTGRSVWFKRRPYASADAASEAADVTFEASTGSPVVRRVYWRTEPATTATTPFEFPVYTPTPSPFRRLIVDYVVAGGARITWEIDNTLSDTGPYTYQLQASQSGIPAESDWTNVGVAELDAAFLIDPSQRMWGVSSTIHYRVVLTTADSTYTSPSAPADGGLSFEKWLIVREVLRKEQLTLRRFVGSDGYLLKAKRYGTRCTTCTNAYTGEVANSSCSVCFGMGIIGGYHTPVKLWFANVGNESSRERVAYNETVGTTRDVRVAARALATVPVVQRDVWVSMHDDHRYYVANVRELSAMQSVPVVYEIELRLAPRSDIIYAFPVERPEDDPPYWKIEETIQV